MHILEIPSFFTPYGGEFCLEQAKALKSLGHEVRILSNVQLALTITPKAWFSLPVRRYWHERDGMEIYQSFQRGIPKAVKWNVEHWTRIVESMFNDYCNKYGTPDIIHAHCDKWAGYASMLISQRTGVPYVVTEHIPKLLLEKEFGPAPSNAWQIPLLRKAYENAAMVIPVSEELVDDTAPYYGKNYKWHFISNTIDSSFFAFKPRRERTGRAFRFVCIANYEFRKGYDILFDAFKTLTTTKGYNADLAIAGRFTDGQECKQAILNRGLKNIHIYGEINKQEVRDLLYQSDVLVLASRSEVQPLVLLEAMSTGIPVVSTECVPQSERIGPECRIVPIGDANALAEAMGSLIDSPAMDGKAISDKVKQLASPVVVGKQLEQIFKEITNKNNNL